MQKLNAIQAYKLIGEGESVSFTAEEYLNDQPRTIKMSLNCDSDVSLYVTNMEEQYDPGTGEWASDTRLLAFIKAGSEQLDFAYQGNFLLTPSGGDIWLHTYDAGNFVVEKADHENYARVFEREEEDPVLAAIKYQALQNKRLLDAQMAQDRAERMAMLAEMQALREAANVTAPAPAPAPAPAVAPAGVAPVGAPAPAPAIEPAASANGGEPNANAGA
ncbi:hypothetical protein [Rhizobium sp. CECT 9324]|uniref:hypothetical protein n=1 Tax=Rhizobium sp. CECT 9324 TaxID=2845820 RepID=UPI001E4AFEC0|nr:hypothetical protein [Rhizobium sp. CECT 9324]CAH0343311.1 hypothetical protein RHI9324_05044 [Rhizobium sp. CECT 9324]